MRTILASIVLACVVAAAGLLSLIAFREPVYEAQPLQSVRVGDPGHNLVGPNWSGNPPVRRDSGPTVGQRTDDAAVQER